MPRSISKAHGLQLVNLVDEGRGNVIVITINGSTDKFSMEVCFKAMDDPSIIGLDMGCKIWFEVLNTYICQIIRIDMCTEVILEQEDVLTLTLQLFIPVTKPLLVNFSCHPCFCAVMVIKPKLSTGLLLLSFVSSYFVLLIDIITRVSPPGVSAILSIFSSLTDLHSIITGYAQLMLANPSFPFFTIFFAIKRTCSLSRHLSVFSNHWGVSPVYLFHYILLLICSSTHYLVFQVLLLNHISVFSNHWGYTLSCISVPKLRFPCICYMDFFWNGMLKA